jgi:hypothetical protein
MMSLELLKKLAYIGGGRTRRDGELGGDRLYDLGFGAFGPDKFEDPRAHEVQPEHSSGSKIERDGAVLAMG